MIDLREVDRIKDEGYPILETKNGQICEKMQICPFFLALKIGFCLKLFLKARIEYEKNNKCMPADRNAAIH